MFHLAETIGCSQLMIDIFRDGERLEPADLPCIHRTDNSTCGRDAAMAGATRSASLTV